MELYSSPGVCIGTITDKVLALNISYSKAEWQRKHPEEPFTVAHAMAFVQRAWVLNPDRANEVKLIFACAKDANDYRKIEGVFQIGRDGNDGFIHSKWKEEREDHNRHVFLAEPADKANCDKYLGKYLPPREKRNCNPVKYIDDVKTSAVETSKEEDVEFID